MMRVTRCYHFPANHRLHTPLLSDAENAELFGKCNYPFGHGHNYTVEIAVEGPVRAETGQVVDPGALDRLVQSDVVAPMAHANLNCEIPEFGDLVATTENLAVVIEQRLRARWDEVFPGGPALCRIGIRETLNNYISKAVAR